MGEEVWKALLAGEFSLLDTARTYPDALSNGEEVRLACSATLAGSHGQGYWSASTDGTVWLTTKKLVYHSASESQRVPYTQFGRPRLERTAGTGDNSTVRLERSSPPQRLYFRINPQSLQARVDGEEIILRLDDARFAELPNSLLSTR